MYSLLKIWNLNECTGVIGVFNCQGAGSWPCTEKESSVQENVDSLISGTVSPADVEYLEEVSGKQWTGDCAVFSFNTGRYARCSIWNKMNFSSIFLNYFSTVMSNIRFSFPVSKGRIIWYCIKGYAM